MKIKRRSSVKVSRKPKNRLNLTKHLAVSHPLILENYDRKKTLKKNYEEMGLISSLDGYPGGVVGSKLVVKKALLPVEWRQSTSDLVPTRQVLDGESVYINPVVTRLGTHFNSKTAACSNPGIIQDLRKELVPTKSVRHQSDQEILLFEELVARHGDDYEKMAMDKKNKFQLSAGQLRKKIKRDLLI
jgi:nucleolar protein 16